MKKTLIFIFFLLLLSFMGFLKERYLIRLSSHGIEIIYRYDVNRNLLLLPDEGETLQHNIGQNPKWISSLSYTILFGFLTVWGIHLLFKKRSYNLISGIFYVAVLFISGAIILLSIYFNAFETGYLAGQHLKNLVQSPLVLLILVTVFYFFDKS